MSCRARRRPGSSSQTRDCTCVANGVAADLGHRTGGCHGEHRRRQRIGDTDAHADSRHASPSGAKQMVFDWTADRCEELDVADGPPRFVRAEDGSLVLFSGNAPRYYVSRGAGFRPPQRDCSLPAFASANRPYPGVLRELGMGVVRLSRRQHVACARAQRVPRCRGGHLHAGDPSPANPAGTTRSPMPCPRMPGGRSRSP